jgi:DNA polymerase-1
VSLLIDADYIVYKCCAANETEIDYGEDVIVVTSNFSGVMDMINRELNKIASDLGCFDDSILYFSSPDNFRKRIDPEYKGHRNRKKPCGYRRAINSLQVTQKVVIMDGLEADDAIGIHATKEEGHIICSPDKDMRQIPGTLYDFTQEVSTITPEEGRRWHLIQTMAGDQTDGYSGIPGIGIKRAEALLDAEGATWKTVVDAFVAKGLDERDAIKNARLAKILQVTDYDFTNQEPRLWTPSSDSRTDNRATVQTEAD